jgi:hypothetical protein
MALVIDSETGDISLKAGDSGTIEFYFWEDDAHTQTKDMTDCTARFTVKKVLDNDVTDAKAVIKIDEVLSSTTPVNLAAISLDSNNSVTGTDVVPGQYYYDLKIHPSSGDNYYAYSGKFTVTQAVTKR